MVDVRVYNYSLSFFCIIGAVLSCYALKVQLATEATWRYKALCDISESVSCTKAIQSPYGTGFGLIASIFGKDSALNQPNSVLGMIFYSLAGTAAQMDSVLIGKWLLFSVVLSVLASVYFAYVLYFKLYVFCIVCVATYVVNGINLVLAYKRLKCMEEAEELKRSESMKKAN